MQDKKVKKVKGGKGSGNPQTNARMNKNEHTVVDVTKPITTPIENTAKDVNNRIQAIDKKLSQNFNGLMSHKKTILEINLSTAER